MIDPDALIVWHEDAQIGYLWRNPVGAIGFRYHPAWVEIRATPISQSLPLVTGEFSSEDGVAHRVFANLLPEGQVREQTVRDLKIPNTDFDLLRAIGGDCASAFCILPEGRDPAIDNETYRSLSDEELALLVAQRGQFRFAAPESKRPRNSLAGAQDKCPVLVRDGRYFLPEGEAPTNHILKFDLPGFHHLPINETFTSKLAKQVGLPVVDIELQSYDKRFFARTLRYDRILVGPNYFRRLHQEDFCQALGYGRERKYEEDGGPTFADCVRLLREVSTNPAKDVRHLLRWQIFNVLAGNSDGHAKNLSLLYQENRELGLAPFYDLVCTCAIDQIDHNLAFAVGGQRNPDLVTAQHWDLLAKECDVGARFLRGLLEEMAASLLGQLDRTKARFEADYGEHLSLQRIEKVVRKQCGRVI